MISRLALNIVFITCIPTLSLISTCHGGPRYFERIASGDKTRAGNFVGLDGKSGTARGIVMALSGILLASLEPGLCNPSGARSVV